MRRYAVAVALFLISFASMSPLCADEPPLNPLVGTWRIVSYPTSEGDLLRRHGRTPGPLPAATESLNGWSYLVFAANGQCALLFPQNRKGEPSHRRITWFHDEDNFATWKLDTKSDPWKLDLGSVACPVYASTVQTDAVTGKTSKRRDLVIDKATGKPVLARWTYPAIARIDNEILTITWWQNHQLLAAPPATARPKEFGITPAIVIEALNQKNPLVRDDKRITIPGGVSCFVCQRYSREAVEFPPEPPAENALPRVKTESPEVKAKPQP